ncbi:MAG: hypothetical protein LAP87_09505 [Acidobacteriia bacterium]|nr:hypothetical protein [Terriglobia bacterium]
MITISILACLGLLLALFLLVKSAFRGSTLPLTAEWISELSIECYRPMMRLLDGGDLEFLRSQPGFTPAMATKLRMQRCRIFQGYLRCLSADFGRVCAAMKMLLVQSRSDRPDLAGILLQRQLMFAWGMAAVQVRLHLYRWGVCGVDVTNLVKIFDLMRLDLRSMVPASVSVGA